MRGVRDKFRTQGPSFSFQWLHASTMFGPLRRNLVSALGEERLYGCVERKEPSSTVVENVNWYNHYREQYGGSSENQKQSYHNTQQFHFWIFIQRNENINSEKTYAPPMFIAASVTTTIWKELRCPSTDE